MKKMAVVFIIFSALFLTACGEESTTDNSNSNPNLFGSFELKCGAEHCFE